MIIYFADRRMEILGNATTNMPGTLIIKDDLETEDIDTGSSVLDLTISFKESQIHEVDSLTIPGNYLLLQDEQGADKFYTIISREKDRKSNEIALYCEDAGLDLLNEVLPAWDSPGAARPVSYYIEKAIHDSGFEIGINEIGSLSRALSWDGEATAKERLLSIATQFDNSEISFSFEIERMAVTHKYVNIYKKRGNDTQLELRLDKDIDNIVTTESIENLATALRVTGGTNEGEDNPITLQGYSYDDGDLYTDGVYLKSRSALARWTRYLSETGNNEGHLVVSYSYDTLSQSELCNRAVTQLKKISQMEVNYEVDIAILPDVVQIGDVINIVDEKGELFLESRVLRIERSRSNQEAKATLGEFLIQDSGIDQRLQDLANKISLIKPGASLYTWVRYADDENGTGISALAKGKKYIGIASNKTNANPSTNPTDYDWTKFVGEDGNDGIDGVAGKDGVGISDTAITYAGSTSGTTAPASGWTTQVPDVAAGNFLWTRTIWTYSDKTTETGYSVARIGKDGNTGEDGIAGKDGVGITNTVISYAGSTSGTVTPTTGWTLTIPTVATGSFLWTRTVWSYSDNTSETGYSVAKIGETGANGKDAINGDGQLLFNNRFEFYNERTQAETGWSKSLYGVLLDAESDLPSYPIFRINGAANNAKYVYSRNIPVAPGTLITVSCQVRLADISNLAVHGLVLRFYADSKSENANSQADTIGSNTYVNFRFDGTTSTGAGLPLDDRSFSGKVTAANAWAAMSITYKVPASAANMKVLLYNSSTSTTFSADYRAPTVVAAKKGDPKFVWIRYADTITGAGISANPTGKKYVGFAYNKDTNIPSNTPDDYTWSAMYDETALNLIEDQVNKIPVTYVQSSAPASPKNGDNWFETNSSGVVVGFHVRTNNAWVARQIDQEALVISKLVAVDIQAATISGSTFRNTFTNYDIGVDKLNGYTQMDGGILESKYTGVNFGGSGSWYMAPTGLGLTRTQANGDVRQVQLIGDRLHFYDRVGTVVRSGEITAESLYYSPWINLPFGANFQSYGTDTCQYRKIKNLDGSYTVKFRGVVAAKSGITWGTTQTIATIPVGHRPQITEMALQPTNQNGFGGRLHVTNTGTMEFRPQAASGVTYFALSGFSYDVDS